VLDAYIIEKIKRDQEHSQVERVPLQIPVPQYPEPSRPRWEDKTRKDDESSDRGVIIIDF